jgi:hypothetical protein
MSPVLKLREHDEKKEILFELKYQLSLTTRQRFEMMTKKSKEIKDLLEKSGHRKPFEIIKRTEGSGRPEGIEKFILQSCKKSSYPRRRVSR